MKVNDPNLAGANAAQVGGTQATDPGAERQKRVERNAAKAPNDEVTLSSLSAKLRELDADSPERAAYLEKLSADVAAGRYKADPQEVSRKMIEDALNDPK